jgi:hypothetical protein
MIDVGRDRCFAFFHACNFHNNLKIMKYQIIRINQLEKAKNTLACFFNQLKTEIIIFEWVGSDSEFRLACFIVHVQKERSIDRTAKQ